MKKIPLTQGKIAVVSEIDYPVISKYRWFYQSRSVTEGRQSTLGYAARQVNGKTYRMHNQIMQPPKGMVVDHIDGNSLNNTRENLRVCSISENNQNQPLRKDNKTGYKGVSPSVNGKWRARLVKDKKEYVFYTDDKDTAAFAYNVMAVHYFGDNARTNPVDWMSLDPNTAMEKLKQEYPESYNKLTGAK